MWNRSGEICQGGKAECVVLRKDGLGHVDGDLDTVNAVFYADQEQAFIKRPVVVFAETNAVADMIQVVVGPREYVGGIDPG